MMRNWSITVSDGFELRTYDYEYDWGNPLEKNSKPVPWWAALKAAEKFMHETHDPDEVWTRRTKVKVSCPEWDEVYIVQADPKIIWDCNLIK